METVNCISLFVLVILQVATADVRTAIMDGFDTCGNYYTLLSGGFGTTLVHWYGQRVDFGCYLTFKIDSSIDKACVTTLTHVMPDCQPQIRFYQGYDTDYKTMDCYSGKVEFCTDSESKITVRFYNMDTITASNVTFKVYGVSEDDDDTNYLYLIQPIATAVGVVVVLIGIVIGWCVFLKISRRKERQRKDMLAANPPQSWAQQAQEQQAQGYTYNTQQNAMYPVVPPPTGAPNSAYPGAPNPAYPGAPNPAYPGGPNPAYGKS